ncbi:RNA ligase/cyclic nucleotide phosphodiesterase [Phaffia rhodozyma]|uniref:RNA ligase/cyclic nucleotide phosphodiesterase n=1 Tax=Phaffia rhodozyma TaxID=264483 RepID=A0A0F7SSJ1_PHARH|nr:RNA ligase/cyclic nucleotide phosphodiesterase [Phaffia rhodozyma]
MTKEPSYSLWLTPSKSLASDTFRTLISSLPGPRFPAHATLLGSAPHGTSLEDVMKGVEDALAEWRNSIKDRHKNELTVRFKDVRRGEEYFRCVLVALEEHPDLMLFHDLTLKFLPSPSERPVYFPHISLLYSDISLEDRQIIVDELYRSKRVRSMPCGGIALVSSPSILGDSEAEQSETLIETVSFDRVSICVTKGIEPEAWKPVGEVLV